MPPSLPIRRALVTLLSVVGFLAHGGVLLARGAPDNAPAIVTLTINGHPVGDVLVRCEGTAVLLGRDALRDTGLVWTAAAERRRAADVLVDVTAIAGVSAILDPARERLDLSVEASALQGSVVSVGATRQPSAAPLTAMVVNYAATATAASRGVAADVTGRLGIALLRGSLYVDSARRAVRGPASITVDDTRRLMRWQAGELLTGSPLSASPRRLIGIALSRDFGIDPGLTRQHPLDIAGSVLTPSTATVYVNGQLVTQTPLAPGEFALEDIPATVGSGDVTVVVRDLFGREQTIRREYYRAPALLRQGMHHYRYVAGRVESTSSGSPAGWAGAAEHRYGWQSWLTVGGQWDSQPGAWIGGPVAAVQGPMGSIEAGLMAIERHGRRAFTGMASYEYRAERFSLGASLRPTPWPSHLPGGTTLDASLVGGVRLSRRVGLHLQHVRGHEPWTGRGARQVVSTTWSAGRRASLVASAVRTVRGGAVGWTASASLNLVLGPRRSAGVTVAADGPAFSTTTSVHQALPIGSGLGYAARWQDGGAGLSGAVIAQHRRGRLEVRQDSAGGAAAVTASGALVVARGGLHATRPIDDAWALVEVPGVAGMETLLSNQPIGRTDRHGRLIVPSLASYARQQIGIASETLPLSVEVAEPSVSVIAPLRSGALVRFAAQQQTAATAILTWHAGRDQTMAGEATLTTTSGQPLARSPIGRGGRVYFAQFEATAARVVAVTPAGIVECALPRPRRGTTALEPILELGVLRCVQADGLDVRREP